MPIMLEQKPALRQTVSLSQRQSLTVLTMGSMELKEFIDREQLENPLLEVEGGPGAGDRLEDIAQWFRDTMPVVEEGVYRDEEGRPEPAAPSGRTYREDLKEQLYSLEAGDSRRELAERMVDLIDPRGFLPYTDLELCRMLGCSPGACQAALAILRALAADYDVLLCDEPFKGLDQATKALVMDYFLGKTKGKTVILVTHDQGETEALGGHFLLL